MNTHVGIAFSDTFVHTAFAQNGKIQDVKSFPYPFAFSYEALFSEAHISALAASFVETIQPNVSENPELSVSLPMHFVHLKKIALPLDAEPELLQHQAEWEFKNYLSGDLAEYKIINSKTEFVPGNYREIVFLAFKKEIIGALQHLAEKSAMALKKIVPVNFLTGDILKNKNIKNALVLKLEKKGINTQLFLDGKCFYSYLDNLENNVVEREQNLFEISKNRLGSVEEMLQKVPFTQGTELKFYIYGDGMTPRLEKLFEEQFTKPVAVLHSDQLEKTNSGLEAVQVLLD